MTRPLRAKTDPEPQTWLGIVSVSTMGSVAGYTQAHATVAYDPPTVEVIPVTREAAHGEHFDVRLLKPGDKFFCDETHMRLVLEQLGEATFRVDPEDPRHDPVATFHEPVVLITWHQLGLIYTDPDTPPPAHFRLVKLTDKREIEIPRLMSPSLVRVLRSQGAATRWARSRADALLARYRVNRFHLRLSQTA